MATNALIIRTRRRVSFARGLAPVTSVAIGTAPPDPRRPRVGSHARGSAGARELRAGAHGIPRDSPVPAATAVLVVLTVIIATTVPAATAAGVQTRRGAISQFMCGSVEHPELGTCGSLATPGALYAPISGGAIVELHHSTGDMITAGSIRNGGFFPGFVNAGSEDYYIARHSAATGARLWVAQGGTSGGDYVDGMALDPTTGDVVVAGRTFGAFPGFVNPAGSEADYYIARHSAATGARLWVAQGGTSAYDNVKGVVLDPTTGDVVVVGNCNGAFPGLVKAGTTDYYIARHSAATGARLWVAEGGSSVYNYIFSVALDPTTGDVVVAGTTPGAFVGFVNAGSEDYYIARHSVTTGARLWVAQGGTSKTELVDGVRGVMMALDPTTGDAVVAGTTAGAFPGFVNSVNSDYYIARHSAATGAQLWVAQGGTGTTEYTTGVALDPTTGNVVVSGTTYGSFPGSFRSVEGQLDYYIACYNAATGARLWLVQDGTSTSSDSVSGITVHPTTGDVVVAGTTMGVFAGIQSNPNVYSMAVHTWYIAAHNGTSGRRLWVAQEGPLAHSFIDVYATKPVVDGVTGDVVIAFATPGQFAGHEDLLGYTYGFVQVPNPVHGRRIAPLAPGQGSGGDSCPGDSTDDFNIINNGVSYLSISGTTSTVEINGPLKFKSPEAGGRSNNNLACSESTRGTTRFVFNDTTGDKVEYCMRTAAGLYEWIAK